jgi:hypothetical protein
VEKKNIRREIVEQKRIPVVGLQAENGGLRSFPFWETIPSEKLTVNRQNGVWEVMGRRPKLDTDADVSEQATTATTETSETTTIRRRRRRTKPNPTDSQALLNALLKARGARGATSADINIVVNWGRGVYAEASELKSLPTRTRRSRNDNTAERQANLELNQALLAGVHAA